MTATTRPRRAAVAVADRRLPLDRRPIAVLAVVVVLAASCAPAGTPASSVGAAAPTGAPGSPGSPEPAGSSGPKPTIWPTLTVEATVALGAANGEFRKMTDDVAAAIDSQDPARILAAINSSIEFLTANQKSIPRLQAYAATKSVGDRLATVYGKMIDGVTRVRDGLTAGDGDAVTLGFQTFFEGATEYTTVSPDLASLAQQAVLMQRLLLN